MGTGGDPYQFIPEHSIKDLADANKIISFDDYMFTLDALVFTNSAVQLSHANTAVPNEILM
jgi:hypothetical protein